MSSPYGSSFCALPDCLTDAPNPQAPQEGLHLYHFGGSYYSQIVRQVLYESDLKWTSHPINLALMDQYKTSYVELNPWCVVPTLIKDGKVTTDCANILSKFTKDMAPHLIPNDGTERTCMEQWLTNVQKIKVESLTYGTVPGFPKPWWMQQMNIQQQHSKKKDVLSKLIKNHELDPDQFLLHAYRAKLQLTSEHERQFTDEEHITEVFASVIELLDEVENQLATGPASTDEGGFLCSKEYSLVDLYYGVFLYRLCYLNMGVDRLWGNCGETVQRPKLAKYCKDLFARPSFKAAVEEYSGWKLGVSVGVDFVKNLFYKSDTVLNNSYYI